MFNPIFEAEIVRRTYQQRLDEAELPFCICERQPIEERDDVEQTLQVMITSVLELLKKNESPLDMAGAMDLPGGQRRAELKYLESLVFNRYSDRVERYVSIKGIKRRSKSPERVLKAVPYGLQFVQQEFGIDSDEHEQEMCCFDDVLHVALHVHE